MLQPLRHHALGIVVAALRRQLDRLAICDEQLRQGAEPGMSDDVYVDIFATSRRYHENPNTFYRQPVVAIRVADRTFISDCGNDQEAIEVARSVTTALENHFKEGEMKPKPKLRVVPNHAAVIGDRALDPGRSGEVGAVFGQRFRVVAARITAAFPQSRIERVARRLPGIGRIVARVLRDRDAADRAWATAQVKIDHVTVGDHACAPDEVDDLPIAAPGIEISVGVTNRSDRPVVARVLVEGVIS